MKPVNVIVITLAMEDASGMKVGAEINARVYQIIVALTKSTKQVSVKSGKSFELGYINIFYLELTRGRKQCERMWALTDYTTIFSFSHTLLQFFCLFSFSSIYRSSFPSIFLLNRRTIIFFFCLYKKATECRKQKTAFAHTYAKMA